MKKRLVLLLLSLALLLPSLLGCGESPDRIVGTCAGFDVPYEELRMDVLLAKADLTDRYGADIWNTAEGAEPYRAELEALTAERIREAYLPLAVAKELLPGVTMEDADIQAAVDAAVEDAIQSYGTKEEYLDFLSSCNMTERLARRLLAVAEMELRCKQKIEAELFTGTELESETTFTAWLEDGNLTRVRRILLPSAEKADEVRRKLLEGETPEAAVTGIAGATLSASFYLVRGYAGDADLEADAFALSAENPVGTARQTEAGYRLLVWEAVDAELFNTYQMPTYFKNMRAAVYDPKEAEIYAAAAETVQFEKNELGESLDLLKME